MVLWLRDKSPKHFKIGECEVPDLGKSATNSELWEWVSKNTLPAHESGTECYFLRRCFLLWVGEPVLTPRPERGEPEFRVFELRESAFREFELRELEFLEPVLRELELRPFEFLEPVLRELELRPFEFRESERWAFELRIFELRAFEFLEPERWAVEFRAFELRPLPLPRSGGTRHSGP